MRTKFTIDHIRETFTTELLSVCQCQTLDFQNVNDQQLYAAHTHRVSYPAPPTGGNFVFLWKTQPRNPTVFCHCFSYCSLVKFLVHCRASQRDKQLQPGQSSGVRTVGRSRGTRRKPTRAQGEHAKSKSKLSTLWRRAKAPTKTT